MEFLIRIFVIVTFLLPVTTYAERYQSSFGFEYEASSDWLVIGKEDANKLFSTEDAESLGLTGYTNSPATLEEILQKIRTGNVEFIFDRKNSSPDFNNNISIQLNQGRTATNKEEAKAACLSVPGDLREVFSTEVAVLHCKYRELNGLGFVSYAYSGALAGTTTIQQEFQITPNVSLIVVGGGTAIGLRAIEELQEHLADRITHYFKPREGSLERAVEEVNQGNYEKALELLSWLAGYNDDDALYNLGYLHENGYGMEQNHETALQLYRRAAGLGNGLASTNIASMYFHGKGVEKDAQKSAALYKQAAEMGIAVAQTSYGAMLYQGVGVEKQPNEALQWFMKAARQGDTQAGQNLLGIYRAEAEAGNIGGLQALGGLFLVGIGVEKDLERGLALLAQAAEAGYEPSRQALVKIYTDGLYGVAPDAELAQRWRDE